MSARSSRNVDVSRSAMSNTDANAGNRRRSYSSIFLSYFSSALASSSFHLAAWTSCVSMNGTTASKLANHFSSSVRVLSTNSSTLLNGFISFSDRYAVTIMSTDVIAILSNERCDLPRYNRSVGRLRDGFVVVYHDFHNATFKYGCFDLTSSVKNL